MSETQATLAATAPGGLDLKNIQGDILSGLPKKTEYHYFFQILNGEKFRQDLAKFVPLVKSAQGVIDDRKRIHDHKQKNKPGLVPCVGINIAFSHLGFKAMGIDDTKTLKDFGGLRGENNEPFLVGQREDALASLADEFVPSASGNIPAWDPAFLQPIHGDILIAADCHENALENIKKIDEIFRTDTPRASIHQVKLIRGDVRPGDQSAHEHFGFLDGVSNPAVVGFDKELPGQGIVRPGVIITGHEGDAFAAQRDWAKDGSFLVFRHLFQEVPEFNKYLQDNPIKFKNLSEKEGSELLGARMVGRWKSGAPIGITPFKDDKDLAKDPQRNNNFKFEGQVNSQFKCPFAAHIRKTNPRNDLEGPEGRGPIPVEPQRIVRRGIQFGPEVTPAEKQSNTTQKGRGLLFVCYQSSIANGFQFQQKQWSNNVNFQFKETQEDEIPGLDPLIGQASGGPRKMSGLDPNDPKKELCFPDFIIPRGGEYFFSPSLKALRETLAKAPTVKA